MNYQKYGQSFTKRFQPQQNFENVKYCDEFRPQL